jgi:type I site-specific restriction endonuclease
MDDPLGRGGSRTRPNIRPNVAWQVTRHAGMHPLDTTGLWGAQVEAITNLERSLCADGRPRALIQMATGSGKTFTAVSFIYRLIKFAGAKRVLFLVDRNNLGKQTCASSRATARRMMGACSRNCITCSG